MKRKVILLGLLLALLGTAGCGQANQRAGSASESARDSINDGHLAIDGHTFRATEKNHMQAIVTVSSKPGATVTAWDAKAPSVSFTGKRGIKLDQNGNAHIKIKAERTKVTVKIKVAYGTHFKTATIMVKPAKTGKARTADLSKKMTSLRGS